MTPTTPARQTVPADVRGPPITTFDDTAGLVDDIALLEPAVIDPLVEPASVVQTHGVLVHEPTGTGKSWLATALLGEFVATEFTLATFDAIAPSPDIVAKFQDRLDGSWRRKMFGLLLLVRYLRENDSETVVECRHCGTGVDLSAGRCSTCGHDGIARDEIE
ncbi:ATP-binding protein [Halomicrobium zhouii]|uniref:hypothetical protein n=1 Tax=Halomicrobium zhouii TaxID=767519 RepID=UPI000B8027FE|nr:hypothetical protein [Halomicrobium zhouii]